MIIAVKLDQLEAEGFHVVDRYLDPAVTDALIAHLECLPIDALETSARVKRGVVFARRNLLSADYIQRFIDSDSVQSLVNLISPGSMAVRAILFDKTGDANWTVPWHQDRSIAVRQRIEVVGFGPWSEKAGVIHVQPPVELLKQMVTLRFSLDACGIDQGPLRVVPQTHHRILDGGEVGRTVARQPQHYCTTAAGGVVIMRPLVLHASSPAKQARHRRVLHMEFGPPALPGGLQWALT
ncbi:MAG TPA: phytanoyl-CoA dioxygenase family protein [Tepidisphaeraceae bacterium]|nr:phytanoyl-CoA dioxygenase family protein [Tepidisphaeraceae bacterium]